MTWSYYSVPFCKFEGKCTLNYFTKFRQLSRYSAVLDAHLQIVPQHFDRVEVRTLTHSLSQSMTLTRGCSSPVLYTLVLQLHVCVRRLLESFYDKFQACKLQHMYLQFCERIFLFFIGVCKLLRSCVYCKLTTTQCQ